jgi:hypothetical protein
MEMPQPGIVGKEPRDAAASHVRSPAPSLASEDGIPAAHGSSRQGLLVGEGGFTFSACPQYWLSLLPAACLQMMINAALKSHTWTRRLGLGIPACLTGSQPPWPD